MSCALMVKFQAFASGADTQPLLYTIPQLPETLLDQRKTTSFLHEQGNQSHIYVENSPL